MFFKVALVILLSVEIESCGSPHHSPPHFKRGLQQEGGFTSSYEKINFDISYKFIYSEKATKFYEIFTLLLSYVVPVKSKVKISQNFVVFSEYTTFI